MAEVRLELTDIRAVWESVRVGLEVVRERTGAGWRPEDVYAACVTGAACLYVGGPGFVVVQAQQDRVTGEPEMLVWVAYSAETGTVNRWQAEVDRIAREGGFKKMVFWSTRAGWTRLPGWAEVATVYERRIDDAI